MQRCYNANAYCELYDKLKKLKTVEIQDFEEFDLISQGFIQTKSIELLEKITNLGDEVVEQICQPTQNDEEDNDDEEVVT